MPKEGLDSRNSVHSDLIISLGIGELILHSESGADGRTPRWLLEAILNDELTESQYRDFLAACDAHPKIWESLIESQLEVAKVELPVPAGAPAAVNGWREQFKNFVLGQGNSYAYKLAKSVADEPSKAVSPVLIFGNPGLGKSHLLRAIANEVMERHPELPVVLTSGPQLTGEWEKNIEPPKGSGKPACLWLIDDADELVRKSTRAETFLSKVNQLSDAGHHIVMCSNRPPDVFLGTKKTEKSSWENWSVADVQSPDTETKAEIFRLKAGERGVTLDRDVCFYLAERAGPNFQIAEQSLNRLIAEGNIRGEKITLDFARRALRPIADPNAPSSPDFQKILSAISAHYQVPLGHLREKNPGVRTSTALQVAVYLTRQLTNVEWKTIGHLFGDRTQSSIQNIYSRASQRTTGEPALAKEIASIMRQIEEKD